MHNSQVGRGGGGSYGNLSQSMFQISWLHLCSVGGGGPRMSGHCIQWYTYIHASLQSIGPGMKGNYNSNQCRPIAKGGGGGQKVPQNCYPLQNVCTYFMYICIYFSHISEKQRHLQNFVLNCECSVYVFQDT